jgi:hypothetical protein
VATEMLEFALKSKHEIGDKNSKDTKKMFVSEEEDAQINAYIASCRIKFMSLTFGRFEFEKYLIAKEQPVLNIKDK